MNQFNEIIPKLLLLKDFILIHHNFRIYNVTLEYPHSEFSIVMNNIILLYHIEPRFSNMLSIYNPLIVNSLNSYLRQFIENPHLKIPQQSFMYLLCFTKKKATDSRIVIVTFQSLFSYSGFLF